MRFSSLYTLCRRAVVVTFDLSAANLHMFDTDHWLANPKNVICLKLTTPAWDIPGAVAAASVPPSDVMRSWPVDGVLSFVRSRDLAGPATALFASGVNGADLLTLTMDVFAKDVRLMPFAVRKMLVVRDASPAGQ